MATTVTNTIESVKTSDHWKACGGHEETYLPLEVTRRVEVNDDTVQRVRPAPPLWRHQTGLGPNYTKDYVTAKLKTADPWYDQQCNDGRWYQGWHQQRVVEILDLYPISDGIDGNWQAKLRAKILDAYVNIGVDLIELDQTAELVREAATLLKDGWVRYVRNRAKHQRRGLNPCTVAAAELVTAYGISPLLSTTYDSVRKLEQEVKVPRLRRIATSVAVEKPIDMTVKGLYGDFSFTGTHKRSTRAVAYIEYVIDASTSGFTLGNPASWVWEKIPFSFVVDWVIPIGGYLESLTAMQGVNLTAGYLTQKDEFETTGAYSGSEWVLERAPKVSQRGSWRIVLSDIPQADFPRFDPKLSVKRALNAISLITVLSSRHNPACNRKR